MIETAKQQQVASYTNSNSCCVLIVFLLLILFSGCKETKIPGGPVYGNHPAGEIPEYHFAIHAQYNPAKMLEVYQPLMDYLGKHIKEIHFTLETSRDYTSFENKYKAGKPEFLLPNPWQTIQAISTGYDVLLMAGDPQDFRGIIIVRKDGSINNPADLRGKTVCYPSATALAACIMPQYFFYQNGVDVNKDIHNIYVGSQESSIMNVFLKKSEAGCTWTMPWQIFKKDHPAEASELKQLWETESLINNSVMVRSDIDTLLRKQVSDCLAHLQDTEEGKAILLAMQTSRFIPASNEDYDIVRHYIEQFEKQVRKIEIR